MKVIQTQATIGADRVLHLQLPADVPVGEIEVLVVVEPRRTARTLEERRAAAEAGLGALKGLGGTVEQFLEERREDDRRRDKALGL
ncbi:MAG: hypothetical protein IT364_12110 [Candidatus Hydrogenedentes bacterium]|nr:hypothetical protein [Candidatus Hydrogenedentota bacterium]